VYAELTDPERGILDALYYKPSGTKVSGKVWVVMALTKTGVSLPEWRRVVK
jgi:hypothetical protein